MADEPVTGTPSASEGASTEALSETGGTQTTTTATPTEAPELVELRKRIDKSEESAEAAKRYVVSLVSELQQARQPQVSEDDRKAAIRERLEQDPEDAIERVFVERMGPLMREQADKQSVLARDVARRELVESGWGDEWAERESAVDTFMSQQPADVRTAPKAWKDALKIVMLNDPDFDAIAMKRATKKLSAEKQAATESASPGRGNRMVTDHLTDMEKRMAGEFGMSADEYLKHKRELATAQAE